MALLLFARASAHAAPDAPATSEVVERWRPNARVALATGLDGNVRYAPPGGLDASLPGASVKTAAFAALALGVGVAGELGRGVDVALGYDFSQIAYGDRALSDYDYQEHALALQLDGLVTARIAWQIGLRGDLSFTGVGTSLRPFQRSVGVEPELTLGRRLPLRLRLAAAYLAVETLDDALAFLSGHRLEARVQPELHVAGWRATLGLRFRRDMMGVATGEMIPTEDPEVCASCGVQSVAPYSHHAYAATLRVGAPFGWLVRPAAYLRLERRIFLAAQYDQERLASGELAESRRETRFDDRLGAGTSLTLRLGESWSLAARYDYTRSASSFVTTAITQDPRRSYHKHAGTLELEYSFM